MRVIYANSFYYPDQPGGAEVIIRNIAEGLVERSHSVAVMATGIVDENYEHHGVKVFKLKQNNVYWKLPRDSASFLGKFVWHLVDKNNFFMRDSIKRVLESYGPDVVVTNNLSGLSIVVWEVAKSLGLPVVHVLHDYYLLCPRVTMHRDGVNCVNQCLKCQIFRSNVVEKSTLVDYVVGVSSFILNKHIDNGLFPNSKALVIHNARAMPKALPRDKAAGLPSGNRKEIVFGYIGAIAKPKGLDLLIDSFLDISKKFNSLKLLVAGEGNDDYVDVLRNKCAGLKSVRFLGKVDALDFFSSIDVCVVPSLWGDPFPGVVFESLSQGVPVVGSTSGGIPEMVQHDVNGVLFDPYVDGALYQALAKFVEDPSLILKFSDSCRDSVSSLIDQDRVLRSYEEVFKDAISK